MPAGLDIFPCLTVQKENRFFKGHHICFSPKSSEEQKYRSSRQQIVNYLLKVNWSSEEQKKFSRSHNVLYTVYVDYDISVTVGAGIIYQIGIFALSLCY